MMPRLVKLVSNRYSQVKSRSTERKGRRNGPSVLGVRGSRHHNYDPGSYEDRAGLKRPYSQLNADDEKAQVDGASPIRVGSSMDVKLAKCDQSEGGIRRSPTI